MGRYYHGDIEGKFMFAVQGSDAAERFCAEAYEPAYINYQVYRGNYKDIVDELNSISRESINRVKKMFDSEPGYNDEIMKKYGVKGKDLSEYADYRLGQQIKEWFDDNPESDYLYFEAEV